MKTVHSTLRQAARTGLAPPTSAPGLGLALPTSARGPGSLLTASAPPGLGLAPPTSAPGLGSPRPHLHRDWVHPCSICTGAALTGSNVPSDDAVSSMSPLSFENKTSSVSASPASRKSYLRHGVAVPQQATRDGRGRPCGMRCLGERTGMEQARPGLRNPTRRRRVGCGVPCGPVRCRVIPVPKVSSFQT